MPTPKPPTDAVDPGQAPNNALRVQAERLLRGAGWPTADAAWLAPMLLRVIATNEEGSSALSDAIERRLQQFSEVWRKVDEDRDAALLVVMAILCGGMAPWLTVDSNATDTERHVDRGWQLAETEMRSVVAELLAHGADFNRALRTGWPGQLIAAWKTGFRDDDSAHFAATRSLLLDTGAIRLDRVVDVDRLRQDGAVGWGVASGGGATEGARIWNDGVTWSEPRALRVWLWYDGPKVLEHLLQAFTAEPPETLAALANGILSEVLNTFGRYGHHHFLEFEKADAELRAAIRPFFDHLSTLIEQPTTQNTAAVREVWLIYFRLSYDGDPQPCPPDVRKRALALAAEDLARTRKLFHAAATPGDTPEARAFLLAQSHFDNCCLVLARHGSIWSCLKPLLLGLRVLNTPCVASDLRFWVEPSLEMPPSPWKHLPNMMAVVVHSFAGGEQRSDPDLVQLREQFASFCLERLTDRPEAKRALAQTPRERTDGDLVERISAWRYCLVRAIADLRANPEGRAHRTLYWSSEHDPDPTVRKAAQQAYHTIRHARGLPERVSPRRAVMSALWWLRQAHLLGLGIQPDRDLAQRTREKELTRTKEVERGPARPDTE